MTLKGIIQITMLKKKSISMHYWKKLAKERNVEITVQKACLLICVFRKRENDKGKEIRQKLEVSLPWV